MATSVQRWSLTQHTLPDIPVDLLYSRRAMNPPEGKDGLLAKPAFAVVRLGLNAVLEDAERDH